MTPGERYLKITDPGEIRLTCAFHITAHFWKRTPVRPIDAMQHQSTSDESLDLDLTQFSYFQCHIEFIYDNSTFDAHPAFFPGQLLKR